MSPIKVRLITKGERELSPGETTVLFDNPRVEIGAHEDGSQAFLELPTSGIEVVDQELVEGEVIHTETLTPPRIPVSLGEDNQVVIYHAESHQEARLSWGPSGEEVLEEIKRQVDSEMERRIRRERFPLSGRLWDRNINHPGLLSGLACVAALYCGAGIESWTVNLYRRFQDRRHPERSERMRAKLTRRATRDYYAAKKE